MDIQEMMQCLLAKMDANMKTMLADSQERLLATINADREERKANRKIDKEDMNANTKTMLAEIQAKAEADRQAYREDLQEIKSGQAEIRSIIKAWSSDLKINCEETMVCQEMTEARLGKEEDKPASMDMTPEVAHEQEVPLEDAVRTLEKGQLRGKPHSLKTQQNGITLNVL
jgi:hypothetical protein